MAECLRRGHGIFVGKQHRTCQSLRFTLAGVKRVDGVHLAEVVAQQVEHAAGIICASKSALPTEGSGRGRGVAKLSCTPPQTYSPSGSTPCDPDLGRTGRK